MKKVFQFLHNMQETKQKYRYYKILDLPVDTVVAKKDGLEMTLEEVDIDTLLAEERAKTINKIKIKVEKHKDKMKDYFWDGDSALEDVLDIINNLDKK